MFSYPSPELVLPDLGDKVVRAVSLATALTRDDFAVYRSEHPDWVSAHSERGLANWMHDRLWDHLARELFEVEDVDLHESGGTREVRVGLRYLARIKRHGKNDLIRTYPTQRAVAFWAQSDTLEGLEEVRLGFGYRWDIDAREIGSAVISLRDGHDKEPIWLVELLGGAGAAGTPIAWTPIEPTLPQIDLFEAAADDEVGDGNSS